MVYANQTDAKKGAALKAFLTFVLGTGTNEGQNLAKTVDYAPLPKSLLAKAKAQLSKVVVLRRRRRRCLSIRDGLSSRARPAVSADE